MTDQLTKTQTKLIEMLKTNTGTSLMDSGGNPQYDADGNYTGSTNGYGRAYERNQIRTFINEPEASLRFDVYHRRVRSVENEGRFITKRNGDVGFLINVFHFLDRHLEYSQGLDDFYNWYVDEVKEEKEDPYLQDMYDFAAWLRQEGFDVASGPYGEGEELSVVNTCNGETNLTQTLQFMHLLVGDIPKQYEDKFKLDYDFEMILLQIHGGADIRGGYTAPVAFESSGRTDSASLYCSADGYIFCNGCETNWQTSDGYTWREDGDSGDEKILDWDAWRAARELHNKAALVKRSIQDVHARELGGQSLAVWAGRVEKRDRSALMYNASFDVIEAYRRGDPALADACWYHSGLPLYTIGCVRPILAVRRLVWTKAQTLAEPSAIEVVADLFNEAKEAMDAVPKRPLIHLNEATFVDIEEEIECGCSGEPMWDSYQEFIGNPNPVEPVPDEQLSLMGDDSDIRASRNRLQNQPDRIKGWGVANQYVLIDDEHNGSCPYCGSKLEGSF